MIIKELEELEIKKIHMIGIGGASMCAISQLLFMSGYDISGSDHAQSDNLEFLRMLGIKVFDCHQANNVCECDAVCFSDAISNDNVELTFAKNQGKTLISRIEMLDYIARNFGNVIAISGAHGKTTTTAMTSNIFVNAKTQPTVHIGGATAGIAKGMRIGKNDYLITEACEFKRNFLKLRHSVAVILNVDLDHIDCYKDQNDIQQAFLQFAKNTESSGVNIINIDDNFLNANKHLINSATTFGTKEGADFRAINIKKKKAGKYSFEVLEYGLNMGEIELAVMGKFNILNALASIATARHFGVTYPVIKNSLKNLSIVERRMSKVCTFNDADVYIDYAHHPTEIVNSIKTFSEMEHSKLICAFEPHTYSRLKGLFKDFSTSFFDADEIFVLDVYSARERVDSEINSKMLVASLKKHKCDAKYVSSYQKLIKIFQKRVKAGDIVLFLGAGDIFKIADELKKIEDKKVVYGF